MLTLATFFATICIMNSALVSVEFIPPCLGVRKIPSKFLKSIQTGMDSVCISDWSCNAFLKWPWFKCVNKQCKFASATKEKKYYCTVSLDDRIEDVKERLGIPCRTMEYCNVLLRHRWFTCTNRVCQFANNYLESEYYSQIAGEEKLSNINRNLGSTCNADRSCNKDMKSTWFRCVNNQCRFANGQIQQAYLRTFMT